MRPPLRLKRGALTVIACLCFIVCSRQIWVFYFFLSDPVDSDLPAAFPDSRGLLQPLAQTTIIRQPQKQHDDSGAAACLVVMDDNHWLIEWLAYHYHVFSLRSLIIVQDPSSRTSPRPILKRWRPHLNITFWQDRKFIKKWVLNDYKTGKITQWRLHRYRQQFFYPSCLREFRAQKLKWVLLVDTDELIRPNPYYFQNSSTSLRKPGAVLTALREYELQSGEHPACLHIPRLQMSSRRGEDGEGDAALLAASVPSFNTSHFLTTSWFYHAGKEISTGHAHLDGKNLVQVQRLTHDKDIPSKVDSVHYVLPAVCPVKVARNATPLIIHHYLGTLEQFTARVDPRDNIPNRPGRNAELYHSYRGVVRDTSTASWLPGFVESVGLEEAQRLLKGVGQVKL